MYSLIKSRVRLGFSAVQVCPGLPFLRGSLGWCRNCLIDGAIAQLGERLVCIQEVCGSIPHSSTIDGERLGCYYEVKMPERYFLESLKSMSLKNRFLVF